jgi:hypothetical protein
LAFKPLLQTGSAISPSCRAALSRTAPSNIEPHLADQRARLDRYRQADGDVVRAVAGALRH